VKVAVGDDAGGNEDLAAAERLVPLEGIREILRMISAGELPAPGPDPRSDGHVARGLPDGRCR
jgi:hypothetical protein